MAFADIHGNSITTVKEKIASNICKAYGHREHVRNSLILASGAADKLYITFVDGFMSSLSSKVYAYDSVLKAPPGTSYKKVIEAMRARISKVQSVTCLGEAESPWADLEVVQEKSFVHPDTGLKLTRGSAHGACVLKGYDRALPVKEGSSRFATILSTHQEEFILSVDSSGQPYGMHTADKEVLAEALCVRDSSEKKSEEPKKQRSVQVVRGFSHPNSEMKLLGSINSANGACILEGYDGVLNARNRIGKTHLSVDLASPELILTLDREGNVSSQSESKVALDVALCYKESDSSTE